MDPKPDENCYCKTNGEAADIYRRITFLFQKISPSDPKITFVHTEYILVCIWFHRANNTRTKKKQDIKNELTVSLSFSGNFYSLIIFFDEITLDMIEQPRMTIPSEEAVENARWIWSVFLHSL